MIETFDIFPSKFFSYKIADQELLQKIYNEVYQKREQIKINATGKKGLLSLKRK